MKFCICLLLTSLVGAIDLNLMTRTKMTFSHNKVNISQPPADDSLPEDPAVESLPAVDSLPEDPAVESLPEDSGFDPLSDPIDPIDPEIEAEFNPPPANISDVIDDADLSVPPHTGVPVVDDSPTDTTDPAIELTPIDSKLENFLDHQEASIETQFHEASDFAKMHYTQIGEGAIRTHFTAIRSAQESLNHVDRLRGMHFRSSRAIEKLTGINASSWQSMEGELKELAETELRDRHQLETAEASFKSVEIRTNAQRHLAYDAGESSFGSFKRVQVEKLKNLCRELVHTVEFRHDGETPDLADALHPFWGVCQNCLADESKCTEVSIFGCPRGWTSLENSCYRGFRAAQDWRLARAFCWSLGADLVKIESAEEHDTVLLAGRIAGFHNSGRFWIGATNYGGSGPEDLQWYDGSPVVYRPNEFDLKEDDCVESFAPRKTEHADNIARAGEWNALNCFENRLSYMCEK